MADQADCDPLPVLQDIKNSLGALLQRPQNATTESRMVPLLEHMDKQLSSTLGQLVKQTNDAATIQRLEEENQNLRNAHAEATKSLRSRKDQQATIERLQKQSKEANDKIKELQRSLKTYEPLPSQFTQTPPLSSQRIQDTSDSLTTQMPPPQGILLDTQNATQDHDCLLSDLPARQVATKTRAPAKRTFEDTPSKPRSTPPKQVKTHDARRRSTQTSTQTESTAIKTSLELGSITYAGEGWSDELKRAFENRLQQYKDRKGTTDDKIAECVNKHLARDPPGCLLAELYRTRMVRAGFSINADVTWYKCGHCEGKAKYPCVYMTLKPQGHDKPPEFDLFVRAQLDELSAEEEE